MFVSSMDLTISTEKMQQSKDFFIKYFNYKILYETDWYIELIAPNTNQLGICFKLPQREEGDFFNGKGVVLSIQVDNVDKEYEFLKNDGVYIYQGLHNKEWGERSFVIKDPNELLIYIYSKITIHKS